MPSRNLTPPFWADQGDGVVVIAEIGVNHNGRLDLALQLVDAAADAGADVVKFQTFDPAALTTKDADTAEYQRVSAPDGPTTQREMLESLTLTRNDYGQIVEACQRRDVRFLSTPFDEASADFLEELGVDAFKVSSGDLTHIDFLAYLAAKGRPMVISTGMGTLGDVERALDSVRPYGTPVILLHCVSEYPALVADANLRAIPAMAQAFNIDVGWSDHTEDDLSAVLAVAVGARLFEKHITLDQNLPGPDHKASMEPHDFKAYVERLRLAKAALGDGVKRPTSGELKTAAVARRSVVARHAIPAGKIIEESDIAFKRPATGIPPYLKDYVIGLRAARDLAEDQVIGHAELV